MSVKGVCTSPNGIIGCKSSTCPGASISVNLSAVRENEFIENYSSLWNAIAADLQRLSKEEVADFRANTLSPEELYILDETPVMIDFNLAELYYQMHNQRGIRSHALGKIKDYEKNLDPNYKWYREYNVKQYEASIARAKLEIVEAEKEISRLQSNMKVFTDKYDAVKWNRAFLVTNGNGHVHKSMSCNTCYDTTNFIWLPEYSDASEEEIVNDAGEKACTVCYPSAPVDVLSRASKIEDPTKREARMEREAKKEAKLAKEKATGIWNSDGSPVRTRWGVVKTERSAEIEAVDGLATIRMHDSGKSTISNESYLDEIKKYNDVLVKALAHKRGLSEEEVVAALIVKADKKIKKWGL